MTKKKSETDAEHWQRCQLNFFLKHGYLWKERRNAKYVTTNKPQYNNREDRKKGGIGYENMLYYNTYGLRGLRSRVRAKHAYHWGKYKKLIAPDSVIHHEWIPETADYSGVALVEKQQHEHGIIDVIVVLEGEIRLLKEGGM